MGRLLWRVGLPLLVLGVGIGAFWLMVKFRRSVSPSPVVAGPVAVEVGVLEREDFRLRVRSHGTVGAGRVVRLVSEVDGRVVGVSGSLRRGGFFEGGELLVGLDGRDYEWRVKGAEAEVAGAALRLAMVEAEARVAVEDWKGLGRGEEAGGLVLRRPQLADARAGLAAAEAGLARARLDLERTELRAPFAGRVRSAFVEVGDFVRRGDVLGEVFGVGFVEVGLPLSLGEFGFLDLPREEGGFVEGGSPGVVLRGRFGDEWYEWRGWVGRVDGEVDVESRMVSVVVVVGDPYGLEDGGRDGQPALRVGMFVEGVIEGRLERGVFVVPRVLLLGGDRVLAVDSEGRLRFRELDVLWMDREVAVARDGFVDGDRLCLSAVDLPQDGARVQVVSLRSAVSPSARGGGLSVEKME